LAQLTRQEYVRMDDASSGPPHEMSDVG